MQNTEPELSMVHVAVGLLINQLNEVLLAWRRPDQHQGSLWEFPGGKIEDGEDVRSALKRELNEELSIDVLDAIPVLQVPHDYGDKKVLLDIWEVQAYRGEVSGREGQKISWVNINNLPAYDFPAANLAIVEYLINKQK